MASTRYEEKYGDDPPVKVEHKKDGCGIDGRRDQHEHTQADWREFIDEVGKR